jgi:hypothetical protein
MGGSLAVLPRCLNVRLKLLHYALPFYAALLSLLVKEVITFVAHWSDNCRPALNLRMLSKKLVGNVAIILNGRLFLLLVLPLLLSLVRGFYDSFELGLSFSSRVRFLLMISSIVMLVFPIVLA